MKKTCIILGLLCLTVLGASAAEQQIQPKFNNHIKPVSSEERVQRVNAFEQRLGLTETQKAKAKEIRIEGHEKMKSVFEEIKAKKQEIEAVKKSRMSVQAQEEKITELQGELKALEKKVKNIRKENMRKFEQILTFKQKRILKQMKEEGRQKYLQSHPRAKKH